MLVVLRAVVTADPEQFLADARAALAALATRPGYLSGRVGRAVDDPDAWVVTCEWDSIGNARRGLTSGAVRGEIMPLMSRVTPEPNAYQIVFSG